MPARLEQLYQIAALLLMRLRHLRTKATQEIRGWGSWQLTLREPGFVAEKLEKLAGTLREHWLWNGETGEAGCGSWPE